MKYLLDTNILIPLEPASKIDLEVNTPLALEFHRLASKLHQELYFHPAIEADLERDKDRDRSSLRRTLLQKYHRLESPPALSPTVTGIVGLAQHGTNDWVDNQLLAALDGNAVDYLVTEDENIHKKAKRVGLHSRAMRLGEAVTSLQDLFEEQPPPPPAVQKINAYELDQSDPIFDSLRGEYRGFDGWLEKCKREHRTTYTIKDNNSERLAALCLLKREDENHLGLTGKLLKICTFKVSEEHNGNRYGELLLKPVFDFAQENDYAFVYATTFEKQHGLRELFTSFGFSELPSRTGTGEIVLVKRLKFTPDEKQSLSPIEFNRLFGPWQTKLEGSSLFIVPIQPRFHQALFPEADSQSVLTFSISPCGHSIKKAYLSNSPIQAILPGDHLLFYRSQDFQSATTLGIVEDALRSPEPNRVAQFVGKRTVYSFSTIKDMCARSEVLAIKFRRVLFLAPPISLNELIKNRCVTDAPQSIQKIKPEGIHWLRQQMKM